MPSRLLLLVSKHQSGERKNGWKENPVFMEALQFISPSASMNRDCLPFHLPFPVRRAQFFSFLFCCRLVGKNWKQEVLMIVTQALSPSDVAEQTA